MKKTKYFYCPYNCGHPGYPRRKWKTEKGYIKHLSECPNNPENIAKRKKEEEEAEKKRQAKQEQLISQFPYKIGDHVIVVSHRVTQPTHRRRHGRMARVRYEEGRHYYASEIKIGSLILPNLFFSDLLINGKYRLSDVRQDMKSAAEEAEAKQKKYEDHCEHAALCR